MLQVLIISFCADKHTDIQTNTFTQTDRQTDAAGNNRLTCSASAGNDDNNDDDNDDDDVFYVITLQGQQRSSGSL